MKESYGFETKAAVRERLREFIDRNRALQHGSGLVLTMMAHESYELEQIWEPLGVRRDNIISVEYDKKVIEIGERNNKGVRYVKSDILDYLCETPLTFSVINLDTTSQFGYAQREAIRIISHRGLLGERGVLSTWYVGAREFGYNKNWFNHMGKKYRGKEKLKKVRGDMIASHIRAIMIDGQTNYLPHPLTKLFPKEYKKVLTNNDYYKKMIESGVSPEDAYAQLHRTAGNDLVKEFIEAVMKKNGIALQEIVEIAFYQGIGSYFATDYESLRYVSDKGIPMVVDFNFFEQLDLSRIVGIKVKNGKIKVRRANPARHERDINLIKKFKKARKACLAREEFERERIRERLSL